MVISTQEIGIFLLTIAIACALLVTGSLRGFRDNPRLTFIFPTLMMLMGLDLFAVALMAFLNGSITASIALTLLGYLILADGISDFFEAKLNWRGAVKYQPGLKRRETQPLRFEKRTLKNGTIGDAMGITNKGKSE